MDRSKLNGLAAVVGLVSMVVACEYGRRKLRNFPPDL